MIKREQYLNELIKIKDKQVIKVITGIRRCGKSTLLEMFQDHLTQCGVSAEQITYINFEDMDYAFLDNAKKLYDFIVKKLVKSKMNYIILDEIQRVDEFQKAVDSLHIKKNTDIYITGSNAQILSGELATLLSGRYMEIEMLPLSFKEYVKFTGGTNDLARKYRDYIIFSSFPFPAMHLEKDQDLVRNYLSGIYNTVVLKDVVARNRISNVMMLESVIRFVFDNVGNLLSTKKIADTMTSYGRKISTHTVESYLSALLESYIIYRAKRFDVKGKQHLKTNDKYYVADIGLRRLLLGSKSDDTGFILENIIYLELLRRGYCVYVGKVGTKEIDFVAQKGDVTEYYQVSLTVRDTTKLKTELAAFDLVNDHNPKFLITMDDDPPVNHNGIRQINALDFLLE